MQGLWMAQSHVPPMEAEYPLAGGWEGLMARIWGSESCQDLYVGKARVHSHLHPRGALCEEVDGRHSVAAIETHLSVEAT